MGLGWVTVRVRVRATFEASVAALEWTTDYATDYG